jgi:uncharacterized SAM-binding protein YcdF (DUF218 family)
MNGHVQSLAQVLWDYHRLNHQLVKSDAILVLCSYDTRVAERGAKLYLDGWAPILIFSGGLGSITGKFWSEPEADQFANIAIAMGVPLDKVLIENKSTNTGENILFTQNLLKQKGLDPSSFILVQKPYMERRALATFRKFWPEKEAIATSAQVSFVDYLDQYSTRE